MYIIETQLGNICKIRRDDQVIISSIPLQVYRYPSNDPDGMKAEWKEFPPFGIGEPDCRETQFSRDNHLGNGIGGQPLVYNWTVPNTVHENCVMRIRSVYHYT